MGELDGKAVFSMAGGVSPTLRVHPAVLLSMMERAGGCTLETVGYAFDTQLAARQAPLGIIDVEIAGYGPASLLWAKDDQPR